MPSTDVITKSRVFQDELDFFVANQEELVREYRGKVLVIRGRKVVGVYSTSLEAYVEAQKSYELGSFMIQACAPGPEAFTATVSSACVVV
jgi:hypothetical protein